MNLCTFEQRADLNTVNKVQALQNGWCCIFTDQTITFLGPDMETYYSYASPNLLALGDHNMEGESLHAFISPNLIEVFKCRSLNDYSHIQRLYNILLKN